MGEKLQNNRFDVIEVRPEDLDTTSLNIKSTKNENNEKQFQKYVKEFCKNTRMYGFNYLVEPNRFKYEKWYWICFILITLSISINLLAKLWCNRNEDPVFSLRQNPKPIWQIPFPAITICPETKIRQSVYNFTDSYHKMIKSVFDGDNNYTEHEIQMFSDMSLVCDNHLFGTGSKTTNSEIIELLTNVAPSLQETFFGCKWTSLNETCGNLFTPTITEDGLCFTFNMLPKQEIFSNIVHFPEDFNDGIYSDGWSLENGYLENADKNTFPRRTTTSGTKGGLFILLKADEQDFDYVCRGPVQGFRVLLHQPSEMPRINTHYFRAPLNQEVIVNVRPNLIISAPDIKNYNIDERQCIFNDEHPLEFFKNYTQENCRTECLANYTLKKCSCVAFCMPHKKSTPVCGSGSNDCMFEAEQELLEHDLKTNICGCLPACTSLTYNAEISQAEFQWPKVLEAFNSDTEEFSGTHMTRIVVFFNDMQFDASLRTKYRTDYTEFLAHCGGILMLFTGFSFLSIAEIVYFLSLRLICNIKKYGKHRWADSQSPVNS